MSPVLNTTLPIGNAPAPALAPLAPDAAKPFELAISTGSIPGEIAPAPASIAVGKGFDVEGNIPADIVPAHAIELLNAVTLRETAQSPAPADPAMVAPERELPSMAERPAAPLPADKTPVSRPIEPLVETVPAIKAKDVADVHVGTKGKTGPVPGAGVQIECHIAPSVQMPVALSIEAVSKDQSGTDVQAEREPTPGQSAENIVSQAVAPVLVHNPQAVTILTAEAAGAAVAQPANLPIRAEVANVFEAPAMGVVTPKAATIAARIDAARFTETVNSSAGTSAVPAQGRIGESLPARAQRSDGVEIPAKVGIDLLSFIPANPAAIDARTLDVAFGSPDGIKGTNPLAELTGATHVAQRHLDLARDTLWLDGLARDIVAASDRSGSMSFRLNPTNLGQLDVALERSDAGLSVMMKTNSDEAARIVTAAQPALVDNIQSHGVRVVDAQVMSHADMSRQDQPQPQRQAPEIFIETGFARSAEPDTQDSKQPNGRFA